MSSHEAAESLMAVKKDVNHGLLGCVAAYLLQQHMASQLKDHDDQLKASYQSLAIAA
jgi:hypothetical protein